MFYLILLFNNGLLFLFLWPIFCCVAECVVSVHGECVAAWVAACVAVCMCRAYVVCACACVCVCVCVMSVFGRCVR